MRPLGTAPGSELEADTPCLPGAEPTVPEAQGPAEARGQAQVHGLHPPEERRGAGGCGAGSGLAGAGKGSPELGVVPAVVGTPSRRSLQEPDRVLMPRSRKGLQEGRSPASCLGWGLGRNTDGAACVRRLHTRAHTHNRAWGHPWCETGARRGVRKTSDSPKGGRGPGASLKAAPNSQQPGSP